MTTRVGNQEQCYSELFLLIFLILAYTRRSALFRDLERNKLQGALIDNFILSAIRHKLESTKIRIEREIPYSITYGAVIRSGSPKTEKCFRKYTHHYPQKIFETISEKLKPVKVS